MALRVNAVILGSGKATRLRPLSLFTPKPLVTVGNVPLLEIFGRLLHGAEIGRASVVLPPWFDEALDLEELRARTGVSFDARRSRPGIRGSIGAALLGAAEGPEPLLVIYGDSLLSTDIGALLDAHERTCAQGGAATLLLHRPADLRESESEGRTYHGVVSVGDGGVVTKFVEKPRVQDIEAEDWANAAVFICERHVVEEADAAGADDFSRHLFATAVETGRHRLYGLPIQGGFRIDLGTVERLLEANLQCVRNEIAVPGVAAEVAPGVRAPDSDFDRSLLEGIVPPAVLGRAVRIGPGSTVGPNVVIGDRAVLGADVLVRDSVVGAGCILGRGCRVEGAFLGESVRLGEGTVVARGAALGPFSVLLSSTA